MKKISLNVIYSSTAYNIHYFKGCRNKTFIWRTKSELPDGIKHLQKLCITCHVDEYDIEHNNVVDIKRVRVIKK